MIWKVLQLADSAFPTGGFAHSGGLEAAHAHKLPIEPLIAEAVLAAAHGSLPIVGAAMVVEDTSELDAFTASTLWSHVAARASRTQGRAWIDVSARAFGVLAELRQRVIAEHQPGHLAPMFGAVMRALSITRDDAYTVFLHLTARGMLSAAVRLGALGPTEAQAIHTRLPLERALQLARPLSIDDVAQTSPIAELVQATHDRLYSRLFQS